MKFHLKLTKEEVHLGNLQRIEFVPSYLISFLMCGFEFCEPLKVRGLVILSDNAIFYKYPLVSHRCVLCLLPSLVESMSFHV